MIYIQVGATGGDGTLATPYGSLTSFAFGGLPAATVLALSQGAHAGPIDLTRGFVLRGACSAETTIQTTLPSLNRGVVSIVDGSGEVRDLTIAESARAGVVVAGRAGEGTLDGVVVSRVVLHGLGAFAEATVLARSVSIEETRGGLAGGDEFGRGVGAELDAMVDLSRVVVEGGRDYGLFGGTGAEVSLSDVAVRDTRGLERDGTLGHGISMQGGSTLQLERVLVERNRWSGVLAVAAGTAANLTDVVIRDTMGRASDERYGWGLGSQRGAVVQAVRTTIDRNRDEGVLVSDGAMMSLTDVAVRDTATEASSGQFGRGLGAQDGAGAIVTRTVFERSHEFGVFAHETDTNVVLTDVVIRDTDSVENDGRFGRGIGAQLGASIALTNGLIDGNSELGVAAIDSITSVMLTRVSVRNTRPRACASSTCADEALGFGVGGYFGARVELLEFEVARSTFCGLHVAVDGQMDAQMGIVSENPVGACVQVSGYDPDRLSSGVMYRDNDVDLQATMLPVPDPTTPST